MGKKKAKKELGLLFDVACPAKIYMKNKMILRRIISFFVIICVQSSQLNLGFIPNAYGQTALNLPAPGAMVTLSDHLCPLIVRGVKLRQDNPLRFDFIIDTGDKDLEGAEFEKDAARVIKYFLAALTVPEDEFWVNLSPYEKNRIIPDGLGVTELGRDLLAQDYLLKQISASLMYPERRVGSKFWKRIYDKAQRLYGTSAIPVNTFNKVWIVPDRAVVYEHNGGAFIGERHLKVMLEEDYIALKSNMTSKETGIDRLSQEQVKAVNNFASDVVREVLIPELEKEVNEGSHFANLRQIFNSMILATWYKKNLRESLLGQVYMDQNKMKGVEVEDKAVKSQIYEQYCEAFNKGVYDYIKKDYDPVIRKTIKRKYFAGGIASGVVRVQSLETRQLDEESPNAAAQILGPESATGRLLRVTTDLFENTDSDQLELARADKNTFGPSADRAITIEREGHVKAEISSGDLESLAELSKQVREKTVTAVTYEFRQVELDSSGREAYLSSIARYYEQQYGFPPGSLMVSFPAVAPLSGNEVLFLSNAGQRLAVIKIFQRSEEDLPFEGEALREIESSVLLKEKGINVPEILDVVSVNNLDARNRQRPLMIVSAVAKGEDVASRLKVLIKAYHQNDRQTIDGIIEEVRSVGEALGRLHETFPPSPGLEVIDDSYDYNRLKQSIEQLYEHGDINQAEENRLDALVDELFGLMEKRGVNPAAVHGDFHGGNVFVEDGKASGFIDTETIFWSLDSEYRGIGNPANDLARFLDNLHDRLVDSTVSTYIINQLEEAFLEGYTRTRRVNREDFKYAIEFYKARTALVALQFSPTEFSKESAKRRLRAYLNRKSIAELTEKLANGLHEGWRAPRKLPALDSRVAQGILFEPRIKPVDLPDDQKWLETNEAVEVYDMAGLQQGDLPDTWSESEKLNALREKDKSVIDIANTAYKDLPPSWQSENRNAAESATKLIGRRLARGQEVTLEDKEWIEKASAIIHIEWLKRPANSWALNDPDLNREYGLLSEEQKTKNRDIIIHGIRLYNPLDFVAATDRTLQDGGILTQADLDREIAKVIEAIDRGEEPGNAGKYIKVAPAGILLASEGHKKKRYRPGSSLVTYVVEKDGRLKDETWRPDGVNPIVGEDTVILSNGPVKYPSGHALAGQEVKGRYNEDGTFEIDQYNGPDVLQNEYLTDVDFVMNPANYGITPTTTWQYGSKTVPNYVIQIPADAEGDFVITTNNGTRIKVEAGDYVVINTRKGKTDGMQGVQAIQFNDTYVDYAEHMMKLNDSDFRISLKRQGVDLKGENIYLGALTAVDMQRAEEMNHLPLFIDISDDLEAIYYYIIPEGESMDSFLKKVDNGGGQPFLTIKTKGVKDIMEEQYLITPSVNAVEYLLAQAESDEDRARIRKLMDWQGMYGKRHVRYGTKGAGAIITSWDKDIDIDVWSTMIDTVYLHNTLMETGILNKDNSFRSVLEVGTGGGHIAAVLAKSLEGLTDISYTDISPYALRLAKKTIDDNLSPDRSINHHAYLGAGVLSLIGKERYDLIVINPPYIPIPDFLKAEEKEDNPYGGTGLIREIFEYADLLLSDNPDAQIVLHVSSLTETDLPGYVSRFGDKFLIEPLGEAKRVPLKIETMSAEWKEWFMLRGLAIKHENAHERSMETFSHTIQAYRIRLKTSQLTSVQGESPLAVVHQRLRNLNPSLDLSLDEVEAALDRAFMEESNEVNTEARDIFLNYFSGNEEINFQIWHSHLPQDLSLSDQIKIIALAIETADKARSSITGQAISLNFRPLIERLKVPANLAQVRGILDSYSISELIEMSDSYKLFEQTGEKGSFNPAIYFLRGEFDAESQSLVFSDNGYDLFFDRILRPLLEAVDCEGPSMLEWNEQTFRYYFPLVKQFASIVLRELTPQMVEYFAPIVHDLGYYYAKRDINKRNADGSPMYQSLDDQIKDKTDPFIGGVLSERMIGYLTDEAQAKYRKMEVTPGKFDLRFEDIRKDKRVHFYVAHFAQLDNKTDDEVFNERGEIIEESLREQAAVLVENISDEKLRIFNSVARPWQELLRDARNKTQLNTDPGFIKSIASVPGNKDVNSPAGQQGLFLLSLQIGQIVNTLILARISPGRLPYGQESLRRFMNKATHVIWKFVGQWEGEEGFVNNPLVYKSYGFLQKEKPDEISKDEQLWKTIVKANREKFGLIADKGTALAEHGISFSELNQRNDAFDGGRLHQEQAVKQLAGRQGADFIKGGIDFNPAMLDLQIKRDGNGTPLPVFQQPIHNMKIDGFLPIITNVTPVTVPFLLGENTDQPESLISRVH